LGKTGRPLAEIASVSSDLPHGHVIPERSYPEDQLLLASKGVMTLRTKQGFGLCLCCAWPGFQRTRLTP
jgi:hypothetical protein